MSSVLRFSRNPTIITPALTPILYISAVASGAGLTNVRLGRAELWRTNNGFSTGASLNVSQKQSGPPSNTKEERHFFEAR